MILALESSTCYLSMGLFEEKRSLFEVNHYTLAGHSRFIFHYLDVLAREFRFQEHLEAVVVGLGPGFFTGVKIASMVGKSLAYILKKPIYGFSTLEAIAGQVREFELDSFPYQVLVPVIFHKKNELFWTEFRRGFRKDTGDLDIQVGSPDELVKSLKGRSALVVTPWVGLKEHLEEQGLKCYDPLLSLPKARNLARLYFLRRGHYQSDWQVVFKLVPIYGSKLFGQ